MSWICPNCDINNVNYNEKCAGCKTRRTTDFEPFDTFDEILSSIFAQQCDRITGFYLNDKVFNRIKKGENMTPEEELFAKFFNHEKILVKDMDTLTLRAHREELRKIAAEARARMYAVDEEEQSRKKDKKSQGFQRSLNVDEASTEAINTIKERQKKLTKLEKIQAGLEKLGISSEAASKLMTSGAVLGRIKEKASEIDGTVKKEITPIFNPFEKKS